LWSFDILFPFWYVWPKKNLATLERRRQTLRMKASVKIGAKIHFADERRTMEMWPERKGG
jgi:hypothetical protein